MFKKLRIFISLINITSYKYNFILHKYFILHTKKDT